MPAVELNDRYPKMDAYWELVKKTLCDVFHAESGDADTLRRELSDRPAEEQLLFYHAEPLDVAADLADQRPDDTQVKAYRQLADQVGWGTPQSISGYKVIGHTEKIIANRTEAVAHAMRHGLLEA